MYITADRGSHGGLHVRTIELHSTRERLHLWILRRINRRAITQRLEAALGRAILASPPRIQPGDATTILDLANLWYSSGIWEAELDNGTHPRKLNQREAAQMIVEALILAGLNQVNLSPETLMAIQQAAWERTPVELQADDD